MTLNDDDFWLVGIVYLRKVKKKKRKEKKNEKKKKKNFKFYKNKHFEFFFPFGGSQKI